MLYRVRDSAPERAVVIANTSCERQWQSDGCLLVFTAICRTLLQTHEDKGQRAV